MKKIFFESGKIKIDFFSEDIIKALSKGIYSITLIKGNNKKSMYVGKSVWPIVRAAQHLYKFNTNSEYLGMNSSNIVEETLTIKFEILESMNEEHTDTELRDAERRQIKKVAPLTQNKESDRQKSIPLKIQSLKNWIQSN